MGKMPEREFYCRLGGKKKKQLEAWVARLALVGGKGGPGLAGELADRSAAGVVCGGREKQVSLQKHLQHE